MKGCYREPRRGMVHPSEGRAPHLGFPEVPSGEGADAQARARRRKDLTPIEGIPDCLPEVPGRPGGGKTQGTKVDVLK